MKPEDKAVVQQALEAFKGLYAIVEIAQEDIDCRFAWAEMPDAKESITALRQLLEQTVPVQEHCDPSAAIYKLVEMIMSDCGHSSNNQRLLDRIAERIQRHIDATTQPAQPDGDKLSPTDAQPSTEDSSEVDHADELTIAYLDGLHTGKQIAKREWVGLTDDEQDEIAAYHGLDCMAYEQAFRAIEAKLREKNGGA